METVKGAIHTRSSASRTSGTGSGRGAWRDAWGRFRSQRWAMAGLVALVAAALVAVAAPAIAPHSPVSSDIRQAGAYRQAAWISDPNPMRTGTWTYPLGTDSVGRDVASRLIYGTRVSLLVGLIPTVMILLIGTSAGLVAGYAGGRVDAVIMRFADVLYAFPALLFFIVIQVSLADTWIGSLFNGLVLLCLTLSILNWSSVARLSRGETLSLIETEFVLAARASGARTGRIVGRHILPNVLGPLLVFGALLAPAAITAEAILSYLGIGLKPDVRPGAPFPTSWGMMIFEGAAAWQSQPWMLVAPTIAVALVSLAFAAIGDGLRDALDPHETMR